MPSPRRLSISHPFRNWVNFTERLFCRSLNADITGSSLSTSHPFFFSVLRTDGPSTCSADVLPLSHTDGPLIPMCPSRGKLGSCFPRVPQVLERRLPLKHSQLLLQGAQHSGSLRDKPVCSMPNLSDFFLTLTRPSFSHLFLG